ncbi:MAG TPA: DUF3572 domain-containing protein [Rhabdaerophilum sp.]|nr:DUF3572 domain-containing protein [Rhabdaerophilum sp.]
MLRERSPADPEALAIAALGFLAEDGERLNRFLSLTGIEPAGIRAAAQQEGFLASVLDYLLADEPLLLAFTANAQMRPETVSSARRKLGTRD